MDVKIFPIFMYKIPWNLGFIHVLFSTNSYPHFPFGIASPFFQVQVRRLPFRHRHHFIISKYLDWSLLLLMYLFAERFKSKVGIAKKD